MSEARGYADSRSVTSADRSAFSASSPFRWGPGGQGFRIRELPEFGAPAEEPRELQPEELRSTEAAEAQGHAPAEPPEPRILNPAFTL